MVLYCSVSFWLQLRFVVGWSSHVCFSYKHLLSINLHWWNHEVWTNSSCLLCTLSARRGCRFLWFYVICPRALGTQVITANGSICGGNVPEGWALNQLPFTVFMPDIEIVESKACRIHSSLSLGKKEQFHLLLITSETCVDGRSQ